MSHATCPRSSAAGGWRRGAMRPHDVGVDEERLPGGWATVVTRVGDTVRREPPKRAEFVRDLLALLANAGWEGAPRFLGVDEQGRDVLTYIAGYVAWQPEQPPDVYSAESLRAVAAMVRRFHDLTAGSVLASGAEVVCHNDLSPKNTVYRDQGDGLRPVAFIDWDLAAPGRRVHDVALTCWSYLDLGNGTDSVDDSAGGMRLLCDSYGLARADRDELVDTVLWWQNRCWRGIETEARAGSAAARRLSAAGVPARVRRNEQWVAEHRDLLRAAL
jgi:tRNA A-37 threonylcarbamoyl transferase component Bud32